MVAKLGYAGGISIFLNGSRSTSFQRLKAESRELQLMRTKLKVKAGRFCTKQ